MNQATLATPRPSPAPMRIPDHTAFTRRFKELIALHSQQDVARAIGFTQGRISQIARGERPSREFVERTISAFELDRDEWLGLAGYGPKEPEPTLQEMLTQAAEEGARRALEAAGRLPESPADYFWRRMRELQIAYKKKDVTLSLEGGSDSLTFAEAEAQLQAIEELWKTDPKD